MATTTPALGGTTLPEPASEGGYKESVSYRGASVEMADGSIFFDLVNATAKRVFDLRWRGLTTTQKGTVETAFATVKTSYSSNNFTSPNGSMYTVTRDDQQSDLKWETVISNGDLRWATSLRLREV